jgi:hypothetical protein
MIVLPKDIAAVDPVFLRVPDKCFLCGEKLTLPAVMWNGCDSQLWLHAKCVFPLCAPLLYDAKKAMKSK